MTPGNTLKSARLRYGLTQAELAERVGTSPQNIGKLERDEIRQPSRDLMMRIGQVLDVPFETLMFGGSVPPKMSEKSVMLAMQIEDLPAEYQLEVYSIIIRAKHESETKEKQQANADPISERNKS